MVRMEMRWSAMLCDIWRENDRCLRESGYHQKLGRKAVSIVSGIRRLAI